MTARLRIGTRGSDLALRQTGAIIAALQRADPGLTCEVMEITTLGDRFQQTPIAELGPSLEPGLFNSALEEAVLDGRVDLATCSFKDVESALPSRMRAMTVLERSDPRDVLLSRHVCAVGDLPPGAVLATSSPRRVSQLRALRPDLRFEPLRGNIPTRVEAAASGRFDGVVVAAAGLLRLGLEGHVTDWLAPEVVLPAPAQGALGCEFAADRDDVAGWVAAIQHGDTETCALAEKALLVELSGGCFAPIGALGQTGSGELRLRCRVVNLDGSRQIEGEERGSPQAWREVAATLAARMAAEGAKELVAATRAELDGAAAESRKSQHRAAP